MTVVIKMINKSWQFFNNNNNNKFNKKLDYPSLKLLAIGVNFHTLEEIE